ncbi:hypothetical protein QYE76_062139 [Lolium multiflorum]|uniref:RNase H type-1 domain-containing protein n=1 Tax=Lolium multiflorum TaxID=4521 RepID=A0AAD8S2Z4_LOLMU|nr:hypothetical protein QYE76_062139 [Lolium multiflorum]
MILHRKRLDRRTLNEMTRIEKKTMLERLPSRPYIPERIVVNRVQPLRICPQAPGLSHLLFADDTLLFFKANQEQAEEVLQILDTFAMATGQLINRAKCSVMFGDSCPEERKIAIRAALQVREDAFEDKYLGLPTPAGRMHRGRFQNLQGKLTKRILQWDDGLLSSAAKEILIKAVGQSIPTYLMGVFKLPFSPGKTYIAIRLAQRAGHRMALVPSGRQCGGALLLLRCPVATALRKAMEDPWPIPALEEVKNTGSEWLLQLLMEHEEPVRAMILMTFWRIWHVRNEIVHLKPAPSIESSKRFLCSYIDSILSIKEDPYADVVKGKMVVQAHGWRKSKEHTQENKRDAKVQSKWQLPSPGWVKLNVDGSFMQQDGDGAAGMVLRDDRGEIIFSSCRYLSTCSSALEAELAATMEGIALAKQWSNAPLIVETDASEVIRLDERSIEASEIWRSGKRGVRVFSTIVLENFHLLVAAASRPGQF